MKRLLWLFAGLPVPVQAATPDAGDYFQVWGSLAVLLAIFGLGAWLLRRYLPQSAARGPLKIIAQTPLGPRERLVVVEVADTWLVLGVGGGQVRTLHTLPRPAPESPT
jgi:flagellar protein FliO/FliZ